MVDLVGIEPTTSSMPWKRAPSCATGPRGQAVVYDRSVIFPHGAAIVNVQLPRADGLFPIRCIHGREEFMPGKHQGLLPTLVALLALAGTLTLIGIIVWMMMAPSNVPTRPGGPSSAVPYAVGRAQVC